MHQSLVNPNCHNEITNAMLKIDSSSNSEMIAKGILNLKRFDWYKSAEQIFEILLKAKKWVLKNINQIF